ncbi:MAG: MBL fold metallo-hydrolase [Angelakisella sp.]
MKLQYLGSGAAEGVPGLFCQCASCQEAARLGGHNLRSRSQALIDHSLLLDFPADTRQHALAQNVDLSAVKTLLFTHSHADHFYPFDLFLRQPPYAHHMGANGLSIYGSRQLKVLFEEAASRFAAPKGIFEFLSITELHPFKSFCAHGYTILPLPTDHMEQEDAFIYLIEKDGCRLLYANDSGLFLESVWEALQGVRLNCVSLDCTLAFQSSRRWHMGFPENILVREKMLQTGIADDTTVFISTHFSHNGLCPASQLEAQLVENRFLAAWDGMQVDFGRSKATTTS